jgi:hypothetical protein
MMRLSPEAQASMQAREAAATALSGGGGGGGGNFEVGGGGGGEGGGGGGGVDSMSGKPTLVRGEGSFGGGGRGPGRPVTQARMSMPTMRTGPGTGTGRGENDVVGSSGRPVLQRRPSMTSMMGVDGMARAAAESLKQPMPSRSSAGPTSRPPLAPTSSFTPTDLANPSGPVHL